MDEKENSESLLNKSLAVLENSVKVPETETFQCDKCNFTTESERGLKVHTKRKHETFLDQEFPKYVTFVK